jgi:hypothetical protein
MPQNSFLDAFLKGMDARDEDIRQRRALTQGMTLAQMQNAIQQRQATVEEGRFAEAKAENLAVQKRFEASQKAQNEERLRVEERAKRDDLYKILQDTGAGKVTSLPSMEATGIDQGASGPMGGVDIAGQRVIPVPMEQQALQAANLQEQIKGHVAEAELKRRADFIRTNPAFFKLFGPKGVLTYQATGKFPEDASLDETLAEAVRNEEITFREAFRLKSEPIIAGILARSTTPTYSGRKEAEEETIAAGLLNQIARKIDKPPEQWTEQEFNSILNQVQAMVMKDPQLQNRAVGIMEAMKRLRHTTSEKDKWGELFKNIQIEPRK